MIVTEIEKLLYLFTCEILHRWGKSRKISSKIRWWGNRILYHDRTSLVRKIIKKTILCITWGNILFFQQRPFQCFRYAKNHLNQWNAAWNSFSRLLKIYTSFFYGWNLSSLNWRLFMMTISILYISIQGFMDLWLKCDTVNW